MLHVFFIIECTKHKIKEHLSDGLNVEIYFFILKKGGKSMQSKINRFHLFGALLLLMIVLFVGLSIDADATFYLRDPNGNTLGSTYTVKQGSAIKFGSNCSADAGRTWTVSDANKAQIWSYESTTGNANKFATIYFSGSGTVTITSKCNGETASVKVTIEPFFYWGSDTSTTIKTLNLTVGQETDWLETWLGTDKARTWTSGDSGIATVSDKMGTTDDPNKYGKIKGIGAGATKITVSATRSNGEKVYAYIKVTVRNKINQVTLSHSGAGENYIYVGNTLQLTATNNPSSVFGTKSWWSNDTSIATVNNSGLVTGVAEGNTRIYYKFTDTAGNEKQVYRTVYVWNKLTSLSLSSSKDWVYVGKTLQLTKTTNSGVTLNSTTWQSLDTAKATVSSSGLVTGVSAGSVKIKCTCTDKKGTSKSAEKTITVVSGITSVDINSTPNWCYVGSTAQLSVTKNPSSPSGSGAWTSSDTSIATVNTSGKVTGVKAGTTTITYTWTDSKGGTASDTLSFTVRVKPQSVAISGTMWCYVGDTRTLTATPSPANVSTTSSTTTWISSNTTVATISTSGVVTGKAVGTTSITCKWKDAKGTEVSTTKTFAVYKKVTSVSIGGNSFVYVGQTITLTGSRIPSDVAGKAEWTSSNSSIATVDASGKVTGVKAGATVITYKFTDNGGTAKTATKTITVKAKVESLSIDGTKSCYLNKTRKLTATYSSEDAYDGTIKWTSSKTAIATVSGSGLSCTVTGKAVGSTSITCTFVEANLSKTVIFYVRQPVTSISISGSKEAWIGQTVQLTATVAPDDSYNKAITWSSSNTSIATVDSNGKVTAKTPGTATIIATANDNQGATASISFLSKERVSDIKVKGTAWCWNGKTRTLTAVVTPSTAHSKGVAWSSSQTSIATVDSNGKVTGKSAGWTTIRATAKDGSGVYGELEFEVRQQITKIEFTTVKDVIWVGQSNGFRLERNITPINPWNSALVWSSSDETIATVSTNGWVAGVSKGTATITCTAKYGPTGEKATVSHTVEVKQQVTDITIAGDTSAWVGDEIKLVATRKPSNANNTAVNWSVSDDTVVSIQSTTAGSVILKAISPGEVVVKATAADGYGTYAEVKVIVYQQVDEIKISGSTWCYVGNTTTLTAECLPTYSYDKTVTWTSSNTSVATIDSKTGVVTGRSAGDVTLTATANDGQGAAATYTMKIYNKISNVVISATGLNLFTNGTNYSQLYAYTKPTSGTRDDRVIWSVTDTSLVSLTNGQNYIVSSNSKVTLIPNQTGKLGSTTIVAKSNDDTSKTISATINIIGFELSAADASMYVGGTYQLDALKTTANNVAGELYDSVKWEVVSGSENVNLNTTSGSGITITAKKSGTAKIRATASANNKAIAECTITIKDFVVKCDKDSIFTGRVSENNYQTATFTLEYEKGTMVNVKWSIVAGEDYATLSSTTGDSVVLTPKLIPGKTEKVVVRAMSTNGDANAYRDYSITLKHPVDEIVLNKASLILFKNTSYSVLATINNTAYNPGLTWTAPSSATLTTTSDTHGATIKAGATPSTKQYVTITANDGRGTTAKLGVSVRDLYLSHSNITMYPNSTFDLSAYYTEGDKSNGVLQNVTWEVIEGSDIVSVSTTSGKTTTLTASKSGTATIKATAKADTSASVTCKITVKDITITFDSEYWFVKNPDTDPARYQSAAHAFVDGKEVAVKWASSNPDAATINATTGKVECLSTQGVRKYEVIFTATIPATENSAEGVAQAGHFIWQQMISTVIKNNKDKVVTQLTMVKGSTYQLKHVCTPKYSDNKTVRWTVEGNSIKLSKATSYTGSYIDVTAISAGVSTIKVTAHDGVIKKVLAECKVIVKGFDATANKTELWASRTMVTNPETATLSGVVDGVSENMNWSVIQGAEFVTLSSNSGTQIALTPKTIQNQTETIIVRATTTSVDANYHKDITFTLKNPVDAISLNKNHIIMYTNTNYKVTATFSNNPYNTNLNWTTGQLSGTPSGNYIQLSASNVPIKSETITVSAADGRGANTSATVEVRKFLLSATSANLTPGSTFKLGAMYTFDTKDDNYNNCTPLNVKWEITSGSDIISLSSTSGSDIVVTGLKAGTAIVKATAPGDATTSLTCKIVVQDINISFSDDKTYVYVNLPDANLSRCKAVAYAKINGKVQPATWTSANPNYLSIDATTGQMVGISAGGKSYVDVAITAAITPTVQGAMVGYEQVLVAGTKSTTFRVRQQITAAEIYDSDNVQRSRITVYVGGSYKLKAKITPTYAFYNSVYQNAVTWSATSDHVSISETTSMHDKFVTITGKKPGVTTVRIKASDNATTKFMAECEVVVKELSLNYNRFVVYVDSDFELKAYSLIDQKVEQSVKWSVKDSTIATISAKSGKSTIITGKKIGTTTVTATSTDADGNTSVSCTIDVRELKLHVNSNILHVINDMTPTSMSLLEASAQNNAGEEVDCVWTYEYIDCTDQGIISNVSDGDIASNIEMCADDIKKPVRKVKITITSTDATEEDANTSDYQIVEFRQQVYTISPSKTHIVMYTGTQYTLDIAVGPDYAFDKDTVWKTLSGSGVVKVTNGQLIGYREPVTLEGVKFGNSKLEISSEDGAGAKTTIDVVVKELSLSDTDITIFKRSTYELFALINGVVSETVDWSVGNQEVVSIVEDKGTSLLLNAKEVGKTTITAKSKHGDTQAVVTTSIEVLDMYVEAPTKELYVGETITMSAYIQTIDSATASLGEKIIWTSSDNSIATVSSSTSGITTVTGVSSGYAVIKATTEGYTQEGYIETRIRVRQQVTEIQLNCKDDILLYIGGSYPVTIAPLPANTDTAEFNWEVLGGNYIAKFVHNGKTNSMDLVGLHEGTSTFKVTSKDKFGASVTGKVTVKDFALPKSIVIKQGVPYTISVNTFSDDATTVHWELQSPYSSGIEMLSKDKDGITVRYNYGGGATLTATTTDADGNISITRNLDMIQDTVEVIFDNDCIYIGKSTNVHLMSGSSEIPMSNWKSHNPEVATVDSTGTVTGISVGKAVIECYGASAEIEVKQQINEIKLNQSQIVIYGNNSYDKLFAIINPANADNMTLNISHSNPGVTTVKTKLSGNKMTFTITGNRAGEDIITFTAADGQGATASCKVIVKELQFTMSNLDVYVGETTYVSLLAMPDNRLVRGEWQIEDETIATVSGSFAAGITGKKVGVTKLIATTTDGDVNASITGTVTVKQAITSISMVSTYSVRVNSSTTLSATITPSNASNMDLEWIVADNSVLKVSATNSTSTNINSVIISGLKVGTTTVTVKAKDGHGATAKCVVTVFDDTTIGNSRIEHSLTLLLGEKHALTFDSREIDGWSGTTTWSCNSSNVNIISTTNDSAEIEVVGGMYTSATVTATTMQNGKTLEHVYSIFIYPPINLPTSLTLYEDTTYTLSAGVLVEWKTSASLIVPISTTSGNSTVLTARDPGVATITAKPLASSSNNVFTCKVTVKRLTLDASALELWVNDTIELVASCNNIAQNVKWSASNNNVSLNTTNGSKVIVTGKTAGSVVISATTTDGDANTTITKTITVKQQVTKLTMKNTLSVYVGKSVDLSILAMPSNATMADIEFDGYNQDLISIKTSKKGVTTIATITGRFAGTTTVTAKAKDGRGATAECVVTVLQGVTNIELPETYTIYVGNSTTLGYNVLPENAYDKTVTWASSNANIATINEATGLIKGLAAGETTITATATDGSGTTASCKLIVLQYVTGIVLENSNMNMYTNYGGKPYTAQIVVKQLLPENASNRVLGWTSDKPEYITVDENGLCTVQVDNLPNNKTYETVTITCTALDGSGAKAKCIVTLRQHVSGVVIIDYDQFFIISNGIITGLTDYALEKLENPNVVLDIPSQICGETIVGIANNVFADCDTLTAITIPSTVTTIGSNTFADCDNLQNIYINGTQNSIPNVPWGATNATIHWLDNIDDEASAIEITITEDNRHLIGFTGKSNENLVIPQFFYDDNGKYYKVIGIGANAFNGCTGLVGVTMPDSVTTIGANAFKGCTALKTIVLSKNIVSIGDSAFANTAITSITIYDAITTIAQNAFAGCNQLTKINVDKFNNEIPNGPWGAPKATVSWKKYE